MTPTATPAGAVPSSWPDNLGFAGKPADPTTGLDLLGAGQYDPVTGAFLSADPVFQPGNPLALGGYTYAADNPTTHTDPTGLLLDGGGQCGQPGAPNASPAAVAVEAAAAQAAEA